MPAPIEPRARIVVVMGVAGCGKTSVGAALGQRFAAPFLDGDDYHPPENVARMRAGTPLTDADRWPWLDRLGRALASASDGKVFGACSALKRSYREALQKAAGEPILFLHLDGSRALIGARMAERKGHYMPPSLLDSQFAALEPLGADENAVSVSVDKPLDEIVETAARAVG